MKLNRYVISCLALLLPLAAMANEDDDSPAHLKEIEDLDQKTLDQAEMLFFNGLSSYRKGKFDVAAEKFQKAFLLTKHRDLLYNIARSREKMKDKKGAVEWYRVYLSTKPSDTTAIINRIKLLGGDPTPLTEIPGKEKKVERTHFVEEKTAGPVPWILASASVLTLGAGIYFGMSALDNADSARGSELRSTAKKFKEDSESDAMIADVSFLVSSVALAGAAYLFLESDKEKERHSSGRVNVMPSDRGAFIEYMFSF